MFPSFHSAAVIRGAFFSLSAAALPASSLLLELVLWPPQLRLGTCMRTSWVESLRVAAVHLVFMDNAATMIG